MASDTNPATPSGSTIAGAAIGIPLATILSWAAGLAGVEVPGPVEAAIGALVSVIVGYFFNGGKHEDVA